MKFHLVLNYIAKRTLLHKMTIWVNLLCLLPFVFTAATYHNLAPPQVEINQDPISKAQTIEIITPYFEKYEEVQADGVIFGSVKYKFNDEFKSITYVISKETFLFSNDIEPKASVEKRKQDTSHGNTYKLKRKHPYILEKEIRRRPISTDFDAEDSYHQNLNQFYTYEKQKNQEVNPFFETIKSYSQIPNGLNFGLPYPLQAQAIGFAPVAVPLEVPGYYSGNINYVHHQFENSDGYAPPEYFLPGSVIQVNCATPNCEFPNLSDNYKPHISTEVGPDDLFREKSYQQDHVSHIRIDNYNSQRSPVNSQSESNSKDKQEEYNSTNYAPNVNNANTSHGTGEVVDVIENKNETNSSGDHHDKLEEHSPEIFTTSIEQKDESVSRSKRDLSEYLQNRRPEFEEEIAVEYAQEYPTSEDSSESQESLNSEYHHTQFLSREAPKQYIEIEHVTHSKTPFIWGNDDSVLNSPVHSKLSGQELVKSKPYTQSIPAHGIKPEIGENWDQKSSSFSNKNSEEYILDDSVETQYDEFQKKLSSSEEFISLGAEKVTEGKSSTQNVRTYSGEAENNNGSNQNVQNDASSTEKVLVISVKDVDSIDLGL